jgi:putative nucleotidyltransferase with HDIG domain
MNLPTIQECEALFQQYHVPKNIFGHCKKVSELATHIAKLLKKRGIKIDVQLVTVGGLLHDLMKAAAIDDISKMNRFNYMPSQEEIEAWKKLRKKYAGMHESEITHDILTDKYPQLAEFILHEGKLSRDIITERIWEEKVVHYADWRVLGTEIVPLDTRLDDFRKRYAHIIEKNGDAHWRKTQEAERQAERQICEALNAEPEILTL